MAKTINQILYETYAQGMFMDVPHRARLYPQPMPVRHGRPLLAKLAASARQASGRALVRLAAVLGARGRRLAEG